VNVPLKSILEIAEERLREFSRRLTDDEPFRKEFASDPKATVKKYGYPIPTELLPKKIESMPTKEALTKKRAAAKDWTGVVL
jgi:hypothetical protein